MKKARLTGPNIIAENIAYIAARFPHCLTEGQDSEGRTAHKIDFDLLKQELSNRLIEEGKERYCLNWPGKKEALLVANAAITKTLRPAAALAATENIFIEGDNLDALKLLQETYLNKIKMIYIDPPYNTGRDFIYKDKRIADAAEYLAVSGQIEADGSRLVANPESKGRFHSDWLSFIYPRLKLARNLLREDGVIFISIDDNEQANLKKLCDEIFGAENFIEIFSWVKTSTPPSLSKKSRKTVEYILCYERSRNSLAYNAGNAQGGDQPLLNSGNIMRSLIFPAGCVEFKGSGFGDKIYQPFAAARVELLKPVEILNGKNASELALSGEFKWTQDFLNAEIAKGTRFIIKSDNFAIRFIRDEIRQKRPDNYIKDKHIYPVINKEHGQAGTNESAAKEISVLFGKNYFDYPKPVSLIKYLAKFMTEDEDLILDFFAGSGTTAQAVMQLNAEDGGRRKFILVQLREEVDEKSEAAKAGFKNIAEICKERIRRAGQMIKTGKYADDRPVKNWQPPKNPNLDIGFRAFKIDSSNMREDYYRLPQETIQAELRDKADNIKPGRSAEDLLFQLFLEWGVPLSSRIEKEEIDGKQVFFVNKAEFEGIQTDMIACFDCNLAEKLIMRLAKMRPMRAVFRDHGFATDSLRENVAALFKQLSPETDLRVI